MNARGKRATVLMLLVAAGASCWAGMPFQIAVKCGQEADGKVMITVTGTQDWRGTVTVRDEKSRLIAIVSHNPMNKYSATQEVTFAWDGKDYETNQVPAGKYTVRVEGLAVKSAASYDRNFSAMYSYVRFDAWEWALFMTGYNYMEEPPWTMDHTLPERYVRRMDFSGLPLGPVIPFDNAHWNHNKLIHDIHDNLYIPGANGQSPQPFRYFKINGRTGEVIWRSLSLPPKDGNPQEWYPRYAAKGINWPRGVVANNGATAMWDTDDTFYCGSYSRYLTHLDCQTGKFLQPPFTMAVDDKAWAERWKLKTPWNLVNFLSVAPNGDIALCPAHQNTGFLMWIRPDGTVLWGLNPETKQPPRPPDFVGASYYGMGTHDNGSVLCDVTGSVYRDGGKALVKFDAYGQLLLDAGIEGGIGDMDISADGHKIVYSRMHEWNALVNELDWAETQVTVSGKGDSTKEQAASALPDIKPAKFLTEQQTPADWLNLGRYQLANKQYTPALEALERVIKESKDPDYQAVALVNIARACQRQGDGEKELATYERLAKTIPNEAGWTSLEAAQIEKTQGKDEVAIKRLAEAAKAAKDKYWQARLLLKLGGWQTPPEAIKTYREVADNFRFARGQALSGLLASLVKEKQWAVAEKVADELIRNYPFSAAYIANTHWAPIQAGLGKKAEPVPVLKIEGKPGTPGDLVPDYVLGQDKLENFIYPLGDVPGSSGCYLSEPNTFGWPIGLELVAGRLCIADTCKGRVVAYDLPVIKNRPEEIICYGKQFPPAGKDGKRGFYWTWPTAPLGTGSDNVYNTRVRFPWGIATDQKRVYVSDHAYHRVLVLDAQNFKEQKVLAPEPLLVLGQQLATNVGFNGKAVFEGDIDTPSAWSMMLPCAISCDGKHLAVADCGNHRILIWNSLPEKTGQPAGLVLGQKDFISAVRGRTGASGLNRPRGVFTDGKMLFVADTMNHRVLIWKEFPTKNGQPADLVLGVPDFETEGEWPVTTDMRIGPDTMSYPHDVYFDGKTLYVCDSNNNRVMIWDKLPEKNDQPCDRYIGMPGPGFGVVQGWYPGYGGVGMLRFPISVRSDDKAIYVSESWKNRVLVFLK